MHRAAWHDYSLPACYLISLRKHLHSSEWGRLAGDLFSAADEPRVVLNKSGSVILQKLEEFLDLHPQFDCPAASVLPDRLLMVWRVTRRLDYGLEHYIDRLKSMCVRAHNIANCLPAADAEFLFAKGFDDMIAPDDAAADRFVRYVTEAPRRRLTALVRPDCFDRRMAVGIEDREFHVYGNCHLLRAPLIAPVIVSRRHSESEKQDLRRRWTEIIRSGGALVSPYISPHERAVMTEGIAGWASIVRILPGGLEPLYRPSGLEVELCRRGRLLLLAEREPVSTGRCVTYEEAAHCNALAVWLASLTPDTPFILHGARK